VSYRYSGASFVYGVAGIVGGGVSPLVATDILAGTHSTTGISWYIIGIAVLSLACLPFLAETRTADYSDGLLAQGRRHVPTLAGGQVNSPGWTI
jgi:nitrate/nitrite transporter NarK